MNSTTGGSSRITERLNRDTAPGWRPEPGDEIIGAVIAVDVASSKYNGNYPVVTVLTEDGQEVAVHGFHSVLKSEFQRKQPRINDTLGVKYVGIPEGKKYEHYRVVVERPHPDVHAPDGEEV